MEQIALFHDLTNGPQSPDPHAFTTWQFCLVSDSPEKLEASVETASSFFGVLVVDWGWITHRRLDLYLDCRFELMRELFAVLNRDGLRPRVQEAKRPL